MTPTLQEVTETINPLIERAERALGRLFQRPAFTDLPEGRVLTFGSGRLQVRNAHSSGYNNLTTLSRKIRLDALSALPALVKELEAAYALSDEQAQTIIDQTTEYLDGLEKRS